MENNNNNNMSSEEKFAKLMEEMRKLGNIRMDGDMPKKENISSDAEDIFETMSKLGMSKVKEAEKFIRKMAAESEKSGCTASDEAPAQAECEPPKQTETKKTPSRDSIIELLYKEYGGNEKKAEFEALVRELVSGSTDAEKETAVKRLEEAAEAEAKAAFIAGFEAAKELFK